MLSQKLIRHAGAASRGLRAFHAGTMLSAKGDSSTIDSYKLPSQTSIHEWEFKYDFIPKTSEPKVPPVTKEAVKQDIAQEKAKQVAHELFAKESNSSVKVEANAATVIHGGESVGEEPEFLHDRGSSPVDTSTRTVQTKSSKPANRDQYLQSSINPNINASDVINLGENDVHHKQTEVEKQTQVLDDLEHDNLNDAKANQSDPKPSSGRGYSIPLTLLGAGGVGYYYYSKSDSKPRA